MIRALVLLALLTTGCYKSTDPQRTHATVDTSGTPEQIRYPFGPQGEPEPPPPPGPTTTPRTEPPDQHSW